MDARGEQLKGCPFCGSDKVAIDTDCGRHHFKCHCCGMMFEFSADTKTELIRKWNRRAQPLERAEAAEAEARRTTGGEVETPRRGGGVMKTNEKRIWLCDQDCNHCAVIHNCQVSLLMNVLWLFHGETVLQIANKICPNMTCCADCRIDDMSHLEGCEIYQEAEKIVEKLCREDRSIATIHAIMKSVDNLAGDLMEVRIELEESKEGK